MCVLLIKKKIIGTIAREFGFLSPNEGIKEHGNENFDSDEHLPASSITKDDWLQASTITKSKIRPQLSNEERDTDLPLSNNTKDDWLQESTRTKSKVRLQSSTGEGGNRNMSSADNNFETNTTKEVWGFADFSAQSSSFGNDDPFQVTNFSDNIFESFNTEDNDQLKPKTSDIENLMHGLKNPHLIDEDRKSVTFLEKNEERATVTNGILKPPKYSRKESFPNRVVYHDNPESIENSDDNNKRGRGRGLFKNAMGAIRRARSRSKERRLKKIQEKKSTKKKLSDDAIADNNNDEEFVYLKLKPKMAQKVALLVKAFDSDEDED